MQKMNGIDWVYSIIRCHNINKYLNWIIQLNIIPHFWRFYLNYKIKEIVITHKIIIISLTCATNNNLGCTELPPEELTIALMVVILCCIRVGIIHPRVIHKNTGPILVHILGGRIIIALLVMAELVFVLGTPTPTTKKFRNNWVSKDKSVLIVVLGRQIKLVEYQIIQRTIRKS